MSEPISISSRAAKQVQEFVDTARRLNEQTQTFVEGLAAALDVPAGWQLDVQQMAFVPAPPPPAAPAPTPEHAQEEADHA